MHLKKVIVYPPKPFIEGHPHSPGEDNVGKFVAVNVKSFAHMLNIIWDEERDENVAIGVRYSYNDNGKSTIVIFPQKVKLLFVWCY